MTDQNVVSIKRRAGVGALLAAVLSCAGCVASDGKLYLMQHPGMDRTDEAIAKKIETWGQRSVDNVKESRSLTKKQVEEEARKQEQRDQLTKLYGGLGIAAIAAFNLWLNRKPKG